MFAANLSWLGSNPMILLITSCISSQNTAHDCFKFSKDLVKNTYFETIVLLRDNESLYATPLGVKVEDGLLKARVFPDTKLYNLMINSPLALLCLTLDPILFYLATLKHSIDYSKCNLLLLVEVTSRKSHCSYCATHFTLRPIAMIETRSSQCKLQLYTRVLGCLVELLIVYSRVKHFVNNPLEATSLDCEHSCKIITVSLDCIKRATQNRMLLDVVKRLVENIIKQLYILGCYCETNH
ncbi:MAG TPA: DUF447 family protein [Pyrodictium sp.]|nr:DUF447 family protein [Pyrodictium sp.]